MIIKEGKRMLEAGNAFLLREIIPFPKLISNFLGITPLNNQALKAKLHTSYQPNH
jgi:hypothetical protein